MSENLTVTLTLYDWELEAFNATLWSCYNNLDKWLLIRYNRVTRRWIREYWYLR